MYLPVYINHVPLWSHNIRAKCSEVRPVILYVTTVGECVVAMADPQTIPLPRQLVHHRKWRRLKEGSWWWLCRVTCIVSVLALALSACVCFSYFSDGMKTIEHFGCYIEDLMQELGRTKHRQDQEKRKLLELRDALKNSMSVYREVCVIRNTHILSTLYEDTVHRVM